MKLVAASVYEQSYRPMSDLTLGENRVEFCHKWGHLPFFISATKPEGRPIKEVHRHLGFEKLRVVLGALKEYPNCDWVWFMDADAMVTNMTFDLGAYLSTSKADVIISCDSNGPNPGPLCVRNSFIGRTFIEAALELEANPRYPYEGEALLEVSRWGGENPSKVFNVVGQRPLNAYDYTLYPGSGPLDSKGTDGQWVKGDFIIHWPGRTMEQRIAHYHHYAKEVVR